MLVQNRNIMVKFSSSTLFKYLFSIIFQFELLYSDEVIFLFIKTKTPEIFRERQQDQANSRFVSSQKTLLMKDLLYTTFAFFFFF